MLRRPEGKTLEFKRDLSSPDGALKTIVAFANTAGGGLLVGVEDRIRHVRGVHDALDVGPVAGISVRVGSTNRRADAELFSRDHDRRQTSRSKRSESCSSRRGSVCASPTTSLTLAMWRGSHPNTCGAGARDHMTTGRSGRRDVSRHADIHDTVVTLSGADRWYAALRIRTEEPRSLRQSLNSPVGEVVTHEPACSL
ncbi:MAG: ATP-binding protein [Acidobacteria bacterium]|nr:ATP-binding protein [Acidobacteriota bacterium]